MKCLNEIKKELTKEINNVLSSLNEQEKSDLFLHSIRNLESSFNKDNLPDRIVSDKIIKIFNALKAIKYQNKN